MPMGRINHSCCCLSAFLILAVGVRTCAAAPHLPKPQVPTASEIYVRSLQADDRYAYRGRQVTTYWRTGRAIAVIVSHQPRDARRIDYIGPDTIRGRSLVSDGKYEWRYDPASKLLHHTTIPPSEDAVMDAAESYDLLRANYGVTVDPHVRTWAERKVYLLEITRKSEHTLARKLWIDSATGLALKRELYQEDGKLVVTVAFSEIDLHPKFPPHTFDLSNLKTRPGVHIAEDKPFQETQVPLESVPRQLSGLAQAPMSLGGYRLINASLTTVSGRPLLHLKYSDGLNLISLFERSRLQRSKPTRVPATMRLLSVGKRAGHVVRHASLTTINWDTSILNVTMMGETSQTKLAKLAADADSAIKP